MKNKIMRFTDLILMMLVLAFCGSSLNGQLESLRLMEERVELLQAESDSYSFISASFRKSCMGAGFASLDEWEKCCAAMWPLEAISWRSVRSDVLCGSWSFNGKEFEVYAKYDSSKGL